MSEMKVRKVKKKAITLSLPIETVEKLDILANKYGMTKSGLVNFLINQLDEKGTLFNT